jgi:hypothetical protein
MAFGHFGGVHGVGKVIALARRSGVRAEGLREEEDAELPGFDVDAIVIGHFSAVILADGDFVLIGQGVELVNGGGAELVLERLEVVNEPISVSGVLSEDA